MLLQEGNQQGKCSFERGIFSRKSPHQWVGSGVRKLTKDKKEEIATRKEFSNHIFLEFLLISISSYLAVVATLFSAKEFSCGNSIFTFGLAGCEIKREGPELIFQHLNWGYPLCIIYSAIISSNCVFSAGATATGLNPSILCLFWRRRCLFHSERSIEESLGPISVYSSIFGLLTDCNLQLFRCSCSTV